MCTCVTVLGVFGGYFEGGCIELALPKQTPLEAKGPPLCKPLVAPPGGLRGILAQFGVPLSVFYPILCPKAKFPGVRRTENTFYSLHSVLGKLINCDITLFFNKIQHCKIIKCFKETG